jgi:hypothetical protein
VKNTSTNRRIAVAVLLFNINTVCALAQYNSHDPSGQIGALLDPLVKSRLGEEYSTKYQVIDSLIGNFGDDLKEEVLDPYGTLRGCILFSAEKQQEGTQIRDSSYFGVMKNGTIAWMSPPVFKGYWAALFGTRDINNDGKVEILITWFDDIDPMVQYMWIVSWDGTSGAIINGTNQEQNSVIISATDMYQLVDADNDGIDEIRGYWIIDKNDKESWRFPEDSIVTLPYVTFRWDGSHYAIAPSAQQIAGSAFLPANQLSVTVNCRVYVVRDSLRYVYEWKNSALSKQRMESFTLEGISANFTSQTMPAWRYLGMRRGLSAYSWGPDGDEYVNALGAGKQVQGLELASISLPSISRLFVQGYRPMADYDLSNPNNLQLSKDDFLANSYKALTIGPTDLPQPFVPSGFLDSISNYVNISRGQGWIANQPAVDKYLAYFASAKTSLQQNNISAARATLGQVLSDANVDSTSNLTSEAYALIRYNTEYLLGQLPKSPSGRK